VSLTTLVMVLAVLQFITLLLLMWLGLRKPNHSAVYESAQQLERELRSEVQTSASGTRQELAQSLSLFQTSLLTQQGDVARTQNEQIDTFRTQLSTLQQAVSLALQTTTQSLGQQAQATQEGLSSHLLRLSDSLTQHLQTLGHGNEQALQAMRATLEQRLQHLQADNEKKLELIRLTVDEKLHATLEQRLSQSFQQVAQRLEQVHHGLGEMQGLARDVGSLNRVLTNIKTRGIWGEMQLAALLEQVFVPEQYAANVETITGSGARVEFALRLPGATSSNQPLWLPIDAKFPREDYERMLDAPDAAALEVAAKALENRLRMEAKRIRDKYVAPPHTTDFGILFVPTEGLYAEALRRPGLVEGMQRDFKVMLAGPTTLLALLNSLQMGFRTLALEKRSAEVWEILGAVKTEFAKFGDVLAKTRKKLDEAANTIGEAETRTRVMGKSLKSVEALPSTWDEPEALELE
jgi:DNA recombination protein RmuC